MVSAGSITRKIRKQLRENGMGDLTVKTSYRVNGRAWQTLVFFRDSAFTALDVLFAFQGWEFIEVSDSDTGFVSLTSPEAGI